MPRHRTGKTKEARSKHRAVNRSESKIKRWNKPADIPLDEEDQFHASRDKILLEGDDYGNDEDDDGDEDEVFALKGISDQSDDDGEEEGYGDEDGGGEDDSDDVHLMNAAQDAKKPKAKGKKGKTARPPSSDDSESEEEAWGKTKGAYYSSNAAILEDDDEEAIRMEEREALRIQSKARDAMADEDFGLGDPLEGVAEPEDVLMDPPPLVVQPLPQDKEGLLRYLEKNSPEALALARDWDDVAYKLVESQSKLAKIQADTPDALSLGMAHLHYQALLTYATTLSFYLHLRAKEQYAQRPELLRVHPILARLLSLKQALATLEDLDFDLSDDDEESLDEDDTMNDAQQLWSFDKKKGLELGELEDLLKEANLAMAAEDGGEGGKLASKRRSKPAAAPDEPPKKKRKTGKTGSDSKLSMPVFDLVEPDLDQFKPSPSSTRADLSAVIDVYGESTSLQAADAADKKARKKSLRFHTAKIESTSARRQSARSAAMGGDDDIPYRERKKQKEERLAREAAKNRGQGGDDLDDVEPEPGPRTSEIKRARDTDQGSGSDGGGDGGGYYELIQRKSKEKKEQKKVEYEAAKAAARPDIDESADGPRALTRAILKNKGLTPHRGKSVRNPRVKKRQRFEKAKKKVSSQKAVYKGGIGDTGKYDGEKTGISRVVKSTRL